MLKKTVIFLVALSVMTLAQTAHADDNSAKAQQTSVKDAAPHRLLHTAQKNQESAPIKKATPRSVTQPLKAQSQATRTQTQGRFVIGTDKSRDVMRVYKTVKYSTAMPNKFKN